MKTALAAALVLAAAAVVLLLVGFGSQASPSRDEQNGSRLITAFGCGGCHRIAGVDGAEGTVGPSLRNLSERRTIAGSLPNTRENVARWVQDPKAVNPGTLMPDLHLTREQARDIAAYLYRH